jgi:hypothetical protein
MLCEEFKRRQLCTQLKTWSMCRKSCGNCARPTIRLRRVGSEVATWKVTGFHLFENNRCEPGSELRFSHNSGFGSTEMVAGTARAVVNDELDQVWVPQSDYAGEFIGGEISNIRGPNRLHPVGDLASSSGLLAVRSIRIAHANALKDPSEAELPSLALEQQVGHGPRGALWTQLSAVDSELLDGTQDNSFRCIYLGPEAGMEGCGLTPGYQGGGLFSPQEVAGYNMHPLMVASAGQDLVPGKYETLEVNCEGNTTDNAIGNSTVEDSRALCEARCENMAVCKGYTWEPSVSECQLRGTACAGYVVGPCQDTECFYRKLGPVRESADACMTLLEARDRCNNNDECAGFAYASRGVTFYRSLGDLQEQNEASNEPSAVYVREVVGRYYDPSPRTRPGMPKLAEVGGLCSAACTLAQCKAACDELGLGCIGFTRVTDVGDLEPAACTLTAEVGPAGTVLSPRTTWYQQMLTATLESVQSQLMVQMKEKGHMSAVATKGRPDYTRVVVFLSMGYLRFKFAEAGLYLSASEGNAQLESIESREKLEHESEEEYEPTVPKSSKWKWVPYDDGVAFQLLGSNVYVASDEAGYVYASTILNEDCKFSLRPLPVADLNPPQLLSIVPEAFTTELLEDTTILLTFNKDIALSPERGSVVLSAPAQEDTKFDLSQLKNQVRIEDSNTLRLTPPRQLYTGGITYTLSISAGLVHDRTTWLNSFVGIPSGEYSITT